MKNKQENKQEKEIVIIDNYNQITCRICGGYYKKIYGSHLASHDTTAEEYKKNYDNAPTYCEASIGNSGKHMQTKEYKEMFSKMFSGENNPGHRSKTTVEERRSRSPFSKDFVKYKDIKEEDREAVISKFAKEAVKDRLLPQNKEYWILRGFNEDEAIEKVKDRQRTFTLDKCIEKYGEDKGYDVFNNRQTKWQNTMYKNGNMKFGYSVISQELFDNIFASYIEGKEFLKYANYSGELVLKKDNSNGYVNYDFTDTKNMKIIEYHGDVFHANPNLFKEDDYPNPFNNSEKYSAKNIWLRDEYKKNLAESNGYEFLVIWDREYKKNKKETLQKCLKFLLG